MILTGAVFFLKPQATIRTQDDQQQKPNTQVFSQTEQAPKPAETSAPLIATPEEIALQRKMQILKEVFATHNDNDPRLDQDFNQLTEAEKAKLEQLYRETPAEKLNERGILVLILARNLESEKDFHFIDELFREPVCLSLSDCRRPPSTQTDEHGELSSAVTLNYPQLVALEKLKEWPEHHVSAKEKTKSAWRNSVNEAQHSRSEVVAREARKL